MTDVVVTEGRLRRLLAAIVAAVAAVAVSA
jgi:hypothetical protein